MWRNKEYLNSVALQSCLYCGKYPAGVAHHVRWAGECGVGMKPADYYAIPLCPKCHDLAHNDPKMFGERVGREEIYEAMLSAMGRWIKRRTKYRSHERRLLDLLAVIHRDGGHRIADIGVDQACEEAIAKVAGYACFIDSISSIFFEGPEFLTKDQMYAAIKAEWDKLVKKGMADNKDHPRILNYTAFTDAVPNASRAEWEEDNCD